MTRKRVTILILVEKFPLVKERDKIKEGHRIIPFLCPGNTKESTNSDDPLTEPYCSLGPVPTISCKRLSCGQALGCVWFGLQDAHAVMAPDKLTLRNYDQVFRRVYGWVDPVTGRRLVCVGSDITEVLLSRDHTSSWQPSTQTRLRTRVVSGRRPRGFLARETRKSGSSVVVVFFVWDEPGTLTSCVNLRFPRGTQGVWSFRHTSTPYDHPDTSVDRSTNGSTTDVSGRRRGREVPR